MDKAIKAKLKELRNMMTYQYNNIYTMLLSGHIKLEDIDTYVNDCPDITRILDERKQKEEMERRKQHFRDVVNMKRPASERYLESLKEEFTLVQEEYNKTLLAEALTEKEINTKNNRLSRLVTKLSDIKKTIDSLQAVLNEQTPKRKVGRPKKTTEPTHEVENEDIELVD